MAIRKGNKHQLGLFFLFEACQRNAGGWSTAVWPANAKLPLPHRRSSITRPCCSQAPSSLSLHACTSKFERSTGSESEHVDALGLRAVEVIICMITRDFSVISMTSQASLSLSLSLSQKSLTHNIGSASALPQQSIALIAGVSIRRQLPQVKCGNGKKRKKKRNQGRGMYVLPNGALVCLCALNRLHFMREAFHRHSRWLYIQQQSSSSSSNRFIEEGPSFRVETSCSIKRLLEDEELCCWRGRLFQSSEVWKKKKLSRKRTAKSQKKKSSEVPALKPKVTGDYVKCKWLL